MHTTIWALNRAEALFGDKEAVVDGDVRLSWAQFGDRCRRLGQALIAAGVKPGDRVATLLVNSHRYFELHHVIPAIGAVIVPINSRLAAPEMAYILEDAGVSVLISDAGHAAICDELEGRVQRIIRAPDEYENLLAASEPAELPGPENEDALCGLYYTGGTTGPAKGVMLNHRNHMANAMATALGCGFGSDDRFMYVFPLFHLGGIATVYLGTWLGSTHVFVPEVEPGLILRTLESERITVSGIVPTVINFLVNHPDAPNTDFSALRCVLHGAAPISPDLCRKAVETFGCEFQQLYGMTEASAVVTVLEHEERLLDAPQIRSAGRAMAGCEVKICKEDGSRCPTGEPGEIVIRGPNIMQGYWKKPEQTAEVLRDGWYWSGDVGYMDESGHVYIVDRSKDMIVTGGENVYSVEVEAALAAHPAIFEVAVIGIPDEKWGEAVHAVVSLKPDSGADADELIAHCRERIAGYKCPKSVSFIDGELPKSAVGKILKRELRAPFWEGHERSVA